MVAILIGSVLLAVGAWLGAEQGWRMAALWGLGAGLGVALLHAGFGFTAAFRRLLAEGRGAGLRAQMVLLALTCLIFLPAIEAGVLFGHPRVAGQPLGLLGFGLGGRVATRWSGPVGARALLYPGCEGLSPAPMGGEAVLLMYGTADPANAPGPCASFAQALGATGASVRLEVFDRASYAWDRLAFGSEGRSLLPRPDGPGRVAAEPWPELAELSASNVAAFFAANLLSSAREGQNTRRASPP